MLGVTAFGIFFTPVFFAVIRRFTEPKVTTAASAPSGSATTPSSTANQLEEASDGYAVRTDKSRQTAH
jgi:hypothetical protein